MRAEWSDPARTAVVRFRRRIPTVRPRSDRTIGQHDIALPHGVRSERCAAHRLSAQNVNSAFEYLAMAGKPVYVDDLASRSSTWKRRVPAVRRPGPRVRRGVEKRH